MSQKSKNHKKKSQHNKIIAQQKRDTAEAVREINENPPTEFELQVGDNKSHEIINGDIPVRWCVTGELIDALNAANVQDPHILLISTSTGTSREMSRQLIPLTQLKTFVRCNKAGEVTLHAWIINGVGGRRYITKKYLRKYSGGYETDMLDGLGRAYTMGKDIAKYTTLQVQIPAGVFGKEPGPRMKRFVNLWHSSTAVDECNYRQRRMLAFALKWEAMLVYALVASVWRVVLSLFIAGLGYSKNVNWSIVLRVFDFDSPDIFTDKYDTIWDNDYIIQQKPKNNTTPTQMFVSFVPMIPTVVLCLYLLIFGVSNLSAVDSVVVLCLVLIFLVKVSLFIDVFVCIVLFGIRTSLWSTIRDVVERIVALATQGSGIGMYITRALGASIITVLVGCIVYYNWTVVQLILMFCGALVFMYAMGYALLVLFYRYFTIDAKHNNVNDVRELLCNDCDTAISGRMAKFPNNQRRIKLMYLEVKNKVCKPMQQ